MKFKELVTVLNNYAYLNIETEKGQWLYEGNVIYITSDGGLTKWIYIRY